MAYLAGVATILPPLRSKFTGTFDFSITFGLGLQSNLCLGRATSPPLACDNGGRPLPRLGSGSDVEVIERLSLLGACKKKAKHYLISPIWYDCTITQPTLSLGGRSEAGSILMMPDLMRFRRLLSQRVFFDVLEVSRDLNSDAA